MMLPWWQKTGGYRVDSWTSCNEACRQLDNDRCSKPRISVDHDLLKQFIRPKNILNGNYKKA